MPAGHGPVLTGSSLTGGVLYAFQTLSSDGNFNHNDQNYATLVHPEITCDGKHCRNREAWITGPRYTCSMCEDVDLCATCVRDSKNGHDTRHKLFRCLVPPSVADPIIGERSTRDNDPGTVTQKGDPEVDLSAGERNEAGVLMEDILEARAAATVVEDESVLRERTVAI